MNTLYTGTVLALDRTNGIVRARVSGANIEASYLAKKMPWPLSTATFEQVGGTWQCLGPVGDHRVLVHDDFTQVPAGVYGDTPWIFEAVDGTVPTISAAAVSDSNASGVLRLTATTTAPIQTSAVLHKSAKGISVPAVPAALWCSARIQSNSTDATFRVGFGAVDLDIPLALANIEIRFATGLDNRVEVLSAGAGGVSAPVINGYQASVGTWATVDVLLAPGAYVAGWVEGNGPVVVVEDGTRVTPAASDGTEPTFGVIATADGVPQSADIDWIHVEEVTPVADPAQYQIA